jgi:hypothetical protein
MNCSSFHPSTLSNSRGNGSSDTSMKKTIYVKDLPKSLGKIKALSHKVVSGQKKYMSQDGQSDKATSDEREIILVRVQNFYQANLKDWKNQCNLSAIRVAQPATGVPWSAPIPHFSSSGKPIFQNICQIDEAWETELSELLQRDGGNADVVLICLEGYSHMLARTDPKKSNTLPNQASTAKATGKEGAKKLGEQQMLLQVIGIAKPPKDQKPIDVYTSLTLVKDQFNLLSQQAV